MARAEGLREYSFSIRVATMTDGVNTTLLYRKTEEEYEMLNKTLAKLYEQLRELGSDPLLVAVPGNHDLVRPPSSKPEVRVLADWKTKIEVRNEFWLRPRCPYRRLVKRAFNNYVKWSKTHPFPKPIVTPGLLPGDFAATFEKEGVKVGIIGLNSTFLQIQAGDFTERLALDPVQITAVCGEEFADWFRDRHLNLLLTHQPPNWLTPDSIGQLNAEIAPPGRFAMHFFGHMHESRSLQIAAGGAPLQRCLQGCSLFGLEVWGEERRRSHGFSLGTFSFSPSSEEASLRIWPRKCEKHQAGHLHLVRDPGFSLLDDGGTHPEKIALNKRIPRTSKRGVKQGANRPEKEVIRVLVLATDTDLAEARSAVIQYLTTALGIEVVAGSATNPPDATQFDFVILLQAWWWDDGGAVKAWLQVDPLRRTAFMVEDDANWPPRKLIERSKQEDIEKFVRGQSWRKYRDPAYLPELAGEVVSEVLSKLEETSGSSIAALKPFERTYLSFRIPSWVTGRTAGRGHLLEPENATELYKPELYVSLSGTSPRWHWRKGQVASLHPIGASDTAAVSGQFELVAPLAKWISTPKLPRVALVGAPGGGKTVFLTRIAAAFANACLGRARELEPWLNLKNLRSVAGTIPIPILLEASRLNKQKGAGRQLLLGGIQEEFAQSGEPPSHDAVHTGLIEGRYILFVDALDEIAEASRRIELLDLLKGISAENCYPGLRIIVTTRSARYTGTLAFGPEFELIDVVPFSPDQVEMFCKKWTAIRKRDQIYYADLMLAVSGLAVQVEREGADEAMTANPLMLTAICMVFERYQSLPDDRARLCSLLVDDLCRSRNSEDLEHDWRLSDARKRDLLERIALAMQQEGVQAWPISRAIEIAIRDVPMTEQLRQQRATKHLRWAAEHTGLLRFQQPEKGEEEIRFWHRLFREFLAASRLSQEDATVSKLIQDLSSAGYLTNPFWEDVLRLLPRALGTLEKTKSLREKLTLLSGLYSGQRGRLLGLLAAGVIESRDLFPDVDVAALAKIFGTLYENEGLSWPLRDRLLFLEGLGALDQVTGDPRLHREKWITIPGGPVSMSIRQKDNQGTQLVPFGVSWAPVTVQEFRAFLDDKNCFREEYWADSDPANERSPDSVHTLEWRKQLRHLNYPVVNVT